MVRAEGLEPTRLASREPKSRASTSSATPAGGAIRPPDNPVENPVKSGRGCIARNRGAQANSTHRGGLEKPLESGLFPQPDPGAGIGRPLAHLAPAEMPVKAD